MSYPTLIKNVGSTGLAPALQPYQVGGLDLSNSIKPFNGTTGGVSGASGTMSTISKMMPYLGAGLGVLSGVSTIINNSKINDVSAYEDLYKDYGNEEYTGDFNQLIQQRRNSYVENVPSWEQIRGMTAGDKAGSAIMSGAEGALAGLGFGPWGALAGGLFGLFASIFGSSLGDSAATNARNKLKRGREDALAKNQQQFLTGVHNAEQQVNYNALSNIAALGGPLHSYGTDWTNGITFIDNGGTHESNPLEGVPMGIAEDGMPNLVEEGEVIYNDYVFSNRLKVPKATREKYKLRGTKDMTFAEAAKKMQKESEERPNDPISKNGLEDSMNNLMQAQELLRQEEEMREFAEGGQIHIKPNKRGTFTAAASKHGMGVQEFASKVLANPNDYSTAMVKKANFARNASKWKHANGGHLYGLGNYLQYAPAIGSGLSVLTDVFGLTNKQDYSNADALSKTAQSAISGIKDVAFTPIGNYLQYKPFDTMFYANQLAAQANATRRAIRNNANGNRMTAIAGLLGADYNAQNQLGNLYRQAEGYNLAQKAKIADFNRATNMFNSEGFLKAAMANQDASQKRAALRVDVANKVAAMKDAVDARVGATRSNNLTGLWNNLGAISTAIENRKLRAELAKAGVFGTLNPELLKLINNKFSKGGKITKRKGLMI
jgi:hypothetical protein